jgi:N6-adenosine-specific RNA methylase IME4
MYEHHEIANIFPLFADSELEALTQDIKNHGLREAIWLYEGKILDGRNRYMACTQAGVMPSFRLYEGTDPVGFVVSLNLHRRHLNESQRGMVSANIAKLAAHRPKENKIESAQICAVNIPTQTEAAQMLNVSRRTVQHARAVQDEGAPELIEQVVRGNVAVSTASEVATLPREEQAEIVAKGEKAILEAAKKIRAEKLETRRVEKIERIAEISSRSRDLNIAQRFPIVYVDPPWRYEGNICDETRDLDNHYPTMTDDELRNLPVANIATDDAMLFVWSTNSHLPLAIELIKHWGFEYKNNFAWVKDKVGLGVYNRGQHELLLVARKGGIPVPPPQGRTPSVVQAARLEHSEKPTEFYELIERAYPELPKIELFARRDRTGWASWGNEV